MEAISKEERKFRTELIQKARILEIYKDTVLLQEALQYIPEEELKIKATQKMSLIGEEEVNGPSLNDLILVELLHWFKVSFFSWMDTPDCDGCGQSTELRGLVAPLETESVWEVSRVEEYICSKCVRLFRFPRYSHPRKLLQTRKGRCGEWAICFTHLCYAMGYDARIVFDWSDHAWTEVLSKDRNEWLHCDPCENAFDKPLMYELGWKKQHDYIIAFSTVDVQDVTWRYITDYAAVCKRRKLVREEFLEHVIAHLTQRLKKGLSIEECQRHAERTLDELISFLTPPEKPEDGSTYDGRASGSLAWRLARGEIGNTECGHHIFRLLPEEISAKYFLVKYNCAADKYVRTVDGYCIESNGWNSWAYACTNILRKLEPDWKKVYLARTENSDKGTLSWKFDFDQNDLHIHKLKVNFSSTAFQSGKIKWELQLHSLDKESEPMVTDGTTTNSITIDTLDKCIGFLLTAILTEGSGVTAWQHAQLFRQPLNSDAFPFEVEVFLKHKDGN